MTARIILGSDFTRNGEIVFNCDIEIYGRDDLIENVNVSSIEATTSNSDLIALAKDELSGIIEKLPAARDAEVSELVLLILLMIIHLFIIF